MIHLIRAGEVGGFLDKSLNSIADNYEGEVKLRGTVKSALTYPVVVLLMAIVAVIGMLLFIVPVFEGMFDESRQRAAPGHADARRASPRPWSTSCRAHRRRHRLRRLVAQEQAHRARAQGRRSAQAQAAVFGQLFRKVAIARFTRNFGTMIGAGVPILQALEHRGRDLGQLGDRRCAPSGRGRRAAGQVDLAARSMREAVFPSMVTQMIAVGEDAGALETMLEKIATSTTRKSRRPPSSLRR